MNANEAALLRENVRQCEVMLRELRATLKLRLRIMGLWIGTAIALVLVNFYLVLMQLERVAETGSVFHALLALLNLAGGLFCVDKLMSELGEWIEMARLQHQMRAWLAQSRAQLKEAP